jgi:hypothetical protein
VGAADPKLLAALDNPQAESGLMLAVSEARLLIPIVPVPAAVDDSDEQTVKRSTDMAVVTLTSADGLRALPVFSSVAALSAWDSTARPSPVSSARAAQAAVSERCDVMLLDAGSAHEYVLRPSMVWALAQQRDWLPAHADPFVAQSLSRATANEDDVIECIGEADPAGSGILRITLALRAGMDSAGVQALATRIGEQIATDGEVRARIDGLAFTIRQG